MSWWSYFTGKSSSKRDLPKNAILNTKEMIATLDKKENHWRKQVLEQDNIVKLNAASNKPVAMQALRRKKLLESEINKLMGIRMNLEQTLFTLENANINYEVTKAMKQGTDAMKQISKGMTPDKVDSIMDDIREQIDHHNEVGELIARPIGISETFNENELNEELERIQQEELDEKMLGAEKPPIQLPNFNTNKYEEYNQIDDEGAEIRALQEEMAI
ncbi:ESCRT-III subunit protein SNF7 [Pneumocystis jirovecii RU7]|uniref:Vacuolar-sorting protein SNF7 n=1 Tax=Pneumocystis jirovecii (strain RU7) TaxID=1408657 RepID=A0A0W4ZUZ6_PNEJ7|nr:ESCRT-III subunit protein SNF7 [Pneumocystis jirovecii RU7]KTW32213.1 hypothetical protein T551_00895 [Pneumocystis jirovecii RU7]